MKFCLILVTFMACSSAAEVFRQDFNSYQVAEPAGDTLSKKSAPLLWQPTGHASPHMSIYTILCNVTGTNANCSFRGILHIAELVVPTNITVLDLSHNLISEIPDNAFGKFNLLTELNMNNNKVSALNLHSFANLSRLISLRLLGNRLIMKNGTFPSGVFRPLVSLTHLWINNNMFQNESDMQYPDTALADLKHLKNLYLDGLPEQVFGEGFRNLTNLTTLELDGKTGWCQLTLENKETFSTLSHLRYFKVKECNISRDILNLDVFSPLENLVDLDISNNINLHLDAIGQAVRKLFRLKTLVMSTTYNPFSPGQWVCTNFIKMLPRSLTNINAGSNSFESVQHDALEFMPPKLKKLDLSNNRLLFASYLLHLDKLTQLEYLDLNDGVASFPLPFYFPRDDDPREKCPSSPQGDRTPLPVTRLILSLPPQLYRLKNRYAGWSYSLTEFHFNATNNLTQIELDGNSIPLLTGPITGLNNLKELSLQNSNIRNISNNFFDNFLALEKLNLRLNYFGKYVLTTESEPLFTKLQKLIHLDLSFTDTGNLNYSAFQGLDKLKTLDLSGNMFYDFYVNMSHMTELAFINFSYTNLHKLNPEMRNMLQDIRNHNNLTVDLTNCPIYCSCENMDFIEWMVNSPIVPKTLEGYKCISEENSDQIVNGYEKTLTILRRRCVSKFLIFALVVTATSTISVFVIGAVIYRFRWKILYMYYSAMISLDKGNSHDSGDKVYDVNISYANDDQNFAEITLYQKLTSLGLRCHIRGEHFKAGKYDSQNIVRAVRKSGRTLVVLTSTYVKNSWCRYEVELANVESVEANRKVLYFLLMPSCDLTTGSLNASMLFYIKSNQSIAYPDRQGQLQINMEQFWHNLATGLKRKKYKTPKC